MKNTSHLHRSAYWELQPKGGSMEKANDAPVYYEAYKKIFRNEALASFHPLLHLQSIHFLRLNL